MGSFFSEEHEPANELVTTYTEQGQRVLDLAQEEALFFHHHYVGAEHLLLGILHEGSAAAPLVELGTTLERTRAGLFFLVGKGQLDPDAGTPFTPPSQNILAQAGREAQGLLQSLGVGRLKVQKPPVDESENERVLRPMERRVAQHPKLSPEEEQQLVHLVARSNTDKRRAERLHETPDHYLVEEGQAAYFRLIYASQHLVLSVAQEYFTPGRDWRALINAGNMGLTFAVTQYGMKTRVPFRAYAAHCIHLEIIEGVLEY